MISWCIRVGSFRKRNGKEYPRISLPAEFRFLIGRKVRVSLLEKNKLIIEWEDENGGSVDDIQS